MSRGFLLLIGVVLLCGNTIAQTAGGSPTEVLERARTERYVDPRKGLSDLRGAEHGFILVHDTCSAIWCKVLTAGPLERLGFADSAIVSLLSIPEARLGACPAQLRLDHAAHLAGAYLSLNEFDRVDSMCTAVLNGPLGTDASVDRSRLLLNHGFAIASLGRLDDAYTLFDQVRREAAIRHDPEFIVLGALNMATVHAIKGEREQALALYEEALAVARRSVRQHDMVSLYQNLAGLMLDAGKPSAGLAYLDSAAGLARSLGDVALQADVARGRAEAFATVGQADSVLANFRGYIGLRESMLNEEKIRAVADVREKYETEKKAHENEQLRAENLEGALEQAELRRTRNIYLFAGLGVLGAAAALWSRLRQTRRSRAAIEKEKDISEGLLHNILPEEVATELKTKGYADAREFERATILFTDFKGFTQMSEKLTAAELVSEIDHCFKAFDGIVEKHGIEKIKTIGDAYMAAGGLPEPARGSPAEVVLAAIEMQEFMLAYKQERMATDRIHFEMRVGIHTGPVIAGIVGVKKFAYDIWGDTVNTASRMESSGEVGKVNISDATYQLVKDAPGLRFGSRGMVEAKGKGAMAMWFATRA